jgi:hypothetical protein
MIGGAHAHAAAADALGSLVEALLVGLAVAVVLWAFYQAIRHTTRPGEEDPDHVKRRILTEDDEERS